jgi:sodium pump decarboxylase gamma subunit
MILQGLLLMAVGMGCVLTFLLMLICVLTVSARVIPRFNHVLKDDSPRRPTPSIAHQPRPSDDCAVAIAIAAAVARER